MSETLPSASSQASSRDLKPIRTALVSVFHKDGLDHILRTLAADGVRLLSTGGTQAFLQSLGLQCDAVEDLTGYPSILGGRVKTLHPKVFGGILGRRDLESDRDQMARYDIPPIDLVIVDLYPFQDTVASGASEQDIIEKIDIGGISLIRAAAKNFADVCIVASKAQYPMLAGMLEAHGAHSTLQERRELATEAFAVSSGYDSAIYNYFAGPQPRDLRLAVNHRNHLRYGENPHQEGAFYGDLEAMFDRLHGKELSYNNLLDVDAATALMADFNPADGATVAVVKHNNACGLATRPTVLEAWKDALAGDPVSAFGGIIVSNSPIDAPTAEDIHKLFFEVIIAPEYSDDALAILMQKKNRIILRQHPGAHRLDHSVRTALNGVLRQGRDLAVETAADLRLVTDGAPATPSQVADLLLANKVVKHSRSNAIVLARDGMMVASGVGQMSRVDALRQAIDKAHAFHFDLKGAVMASDAFFPFADCVEIAAAAGVNAVVQPGGSIRDNDSIEWCNQHGVAMYMTGTRHFRH